MSETQKTFGLNQSFPYVCERGTVNGAPVPDDYMKEADLAGEAAALSEALDAKQWRTILAAIRTGLPVVIESKIKIGSGEAIQRTTAIIEYATIHTPQSSKIRVRYWGFGHDIWASTIVSVDTPSIEYVN